LLPGARGALLRLYCRRWHSLPNIPAAKQTSPSPPRCCTTCLPPAVAVLCTPACAASPHAPMPYGHTVAAPLTHATLPRRLQHRAGGRGLLRPAGNGGLAASICSTTNHACLAICARGRFLVVTYAFYVEWFAVEPCLRFAGRGRFGGLQACTLVFGCRTAALSRRAGVGSAKACVTPGIAASIPPPAAAPPVPAFVVLPNLPRLRTPCTTTALPPHGTGARTLAVLLCTAAGAPHWRLLNWPRSSQHAAPAAANLLHASARAETRARAHAALRCRAAPAPHLLYTAAGHS